MMDNSEAYRILTRELTRMHSTERDILDRSYGYQGALDAVKGGYTDLAHEFVQDMRTNAGDAWRAEQGITFWGEKL